MELDLQSSQQFLAKLRMKRNTDASPIRSGPTEEAWSADDTGSRSTDSPVWRRVSMATQRAQQPNGKNLVQKTRQIEWVIHLQRVAHGLMTKLHKLHQLLGPADLSLHYPDAFWKTNVFPDLPKLCLHVARKFPEHPAKMQLDKVDKAGVDILHENAARYVASLEPWIMVLEDLMTFREQSLRVILDLSSTVVTLLPNQNPLLLRVFMELFCCFVRVNLLADKVPRKMLLQMYNLVHTMMKSGRDYGAYHRMVQFVEAYDPPLKGLHDDLNFVSPRIGEILDAVGPTVLLGSDFQKLRSEGYLSPFHPRYPEKLTNSAHPARAQELVNIEAYREWALIGYLVCPTELLRPGAVDITSVLLKESLLLPLFRDEYILLHEEYQQYVLPRIAESKKLAKAGRAKGRDADVEYNLAKQVEKQICDAQDTAINNADSAHKEHRLLLKQEIGRMLLFFSDQPTLLAPNLQMVFAALVMIRAEILWFFSHVGVTVGKTKGARVMPIEMDMEDPTIGFLLDGMDRLVSLIRKYTPACRAFAMGYLSAAVQRMQILLVGPGMVALDIDPELRELFNSALESLDQLPKIQNDKVVPSSLDLSAFRRDWLRLIMLVSSSRSPINIRHLDKATASTGNDSIVAEGNLAYMWSRSVDEMDEQILQHTSLKVLSFYRPDVTAVFRHTMFGPEGRPQHCCAWLSLACTFPDNAHPNVPDELPKFSRDAVAYAESILDSVMGGLEGLINILDSEGGYGSLDNKVAASVVAGSELKPQPERGSEFAGFWTEQNPLGNKPVELPICPPNETLSALKLAALGRPGSQGRDTTVAPPQPPEKTPFIPAEALPVVDNQRTATPVNLPAVNPKCDSPAPFNANVSVESLVGLGNSARERSVESLHGPRSFKSANADAAIRRVDEASILSSKRSTSHSSRSLCQGCLLEVTIKNNPPHVLPLPPGKDGVIHVSKDEVLFPGNTDRLAQLKIGSPLSRLSKEPVLGGSCREARSWGSLGASVRRAPNSVPTSPCSSSIEFLRAFKSSRESRVSKLWRILRLSGIRSRVGSNVSITAGKRNSSSRGTGKLAKEKPSKAVNKPVVSQYQKLVESWGGRIAQSRNQGLQADQDLGNRDKHLPTIQSECIEVKSNKNNINARRDSSTQPDGRSHQGNEPALQERSNQTRGSRWLFKWRWGSKSKAKTRGKCLSSPRARGVSPTPDVTSGPWYTKSERLGVNGRCGEKRVPGTRARHRRNSSWGCASRASTAVVNPEILQNAPTNTPCSRLPDDRGATESSPMPSRSAGSRVSRLRCRGSQSSRTEEASRNLQDSFRGHSFRSVGGHSCRSIGGQSFRSAGGQSFRSLGSGGGLSFRKDLVFEDCHGSFRSVDSPGSYGSFRSVDSPSMRSIGGSNRFPSVEEVEWDSRLPPRLHGDQNHFVDVASLCNSSMKFVFKCREVQHFNRFLRTQRKCILRGSEKGNTDRFHVILSGADTEVSSMVTAMCYAWFLENTVPKVTGEAWHAVAVIDIPRHQMHKQKDAAWLFDACGIDAAALLFADELEMASLVEAGRIKTSTVGQDVLVTRNEVGSVCTLLGEKLLAEAQCLLEPRYMKTLLLAGLLLETENLDFASRRDTEMTTTLLVGSGSLGRNGLFNQLKGVEDDERVSKFISRKYGDDKRPACGKEFSGAQAKIQEEADQEQFDKDSLFTPSQDQTSTSETGTTSSLDEDSPRLKQRSSFKYTKLQSHSAPARSHQLPSPSSAGCEEDEITVSVRRKAATRSASAVPTCGARSPISTRIQKKLFLYQV